MELFTLEKHDFIELNKLLKITQLASSGGEANQLITEGHIMVNGQLEKQKRKKIRHGDLVEFNGQTVKVANE